MTKTKSKTVTCFLPCFISSLFVSFFPSSCRSCLSSSPARFPFSLSFGDTQHSFSPASSFLLFPSFPYPVSEYFSSPCAFPSEHNISEYKPKTCRFFVLPSKTSYTADYKSFSETTGMYKKHSTRPTKIPNLETSAEQILSSPRKIRETTKKQRLPGQDKSITRSKPQMHQTL